MRAVPLVLFVAPSVHLAHSELVSVFLALGRFSPSGAYVPVLVDSATHLGVVEEYLVGQIQIDSG